MNQSKSRAIDLMVEDLHTAHHEIRCTAKKDGCEEDLNVIKQQLLDYLNFLKRTP